MCMCEDIIALMLGVPSSSMGRSTHDHRCVMHGCGPCFGVCDYDNVLCGFARESVCCWLTHACCCAYEALVDGVGCGVRTGGAQGEVCHIGVHCMSCGVKKRGAGQPACAGTDQCLCHYGVYSWPLNEKYAPTQVWACCFLELVPKCGFCVEPPPSKVDGGVDASGRLQEYLPKVLELAEAPSSATIQRNDSVTPATEDTHAACSTTRAPFESS